MRSVLALTVLCVAIAPTLSVAAENTEPPKEVVQVLKFYAGQWSVDGKIGDTRYKGRALLRMPPGNHCIIGTVTMRSREDSFSFSIVTGWDSSTGWVTEQGAGMDGMIYRLPWKRVSPRVYKGNAVGTANGKRYTEQDTIEHKGEDHFVVVCTKRKLGDKELPDVTFKYHRKQAQKSKK